VVEALEGKPRVLSVRFGVNPNSSSLGVDVTYLLFGGVGALAVGLALSAWLQGFARRLTTVGQDPRPPSAPAP
jgi:hypothetical protein